MSNIKAQQAAAPAQAAAAPGGANRFPKSLGVPGLLWILAGLLVCVSFFLPWFSSSLACNDPVCASPTLKDLSHYTTSATGFSIASGTFTLNTTGPTGPMQEGFSFLLLWLVFLAGLLLIALPLLLALRKMDAQRTRVFLLALGLLALVIEVGYSVSAALALSQTKTGLTLLLNGLAASSKREAVFAFSTGPAAGFWLALVATLVAVGASVYALASAAGRSLDAGIFWRNLGLSGQSSLVAGLALVVAFFLPWFSTPDPMTGPNGGYVVSKQVVKVAQTATTSGWNTAANGLQTPLLTGGQCSACVSPHVSIFLALWLVPLAALGLVAIAWLLGQGRLWRRMAAILACVTCLVALALETFFLLEVQSLQSYDQQVFQSAGQQLTGTAYSVAWGFWVALAVSGLALLLSGFLLLQRHKSVTGMPAIP